MAWREEWLSSINQISELEWNSLIPPDTSPCHEWGWLHAMEASGSIQPSEGWHPCHLVVRDQTGQAIAAAVLYQKFNSHGEYVYDYYWAEIAQRLGLEYYPKLVATIAATPSPDYRFLIKPDQNLSQITDYILDCIDRYARVNGLGSVHFLFVHPELASHLRHRPLKVWHHHRYLWENHSYADFNDFLQSFGKNQRRNIRRERQSVSEQPLLLDICPISQLSKGEQESNAQWMWEFYRSTNEQFGPWAARYLNEDFFMRSIRDCHDSLVYARARLPGQDQPVAMTLMVRRGQQLYGRFWGARDFYPDLHFELCYYLPIEWCIEQGIQRFDPGAGSPHKIRRGFLAYQTDSYHQYFDPRMHSVFSTMMPEVNRYEIDQIKELNSGSPLRKNPNEE